MTKIVLKKKTSAIFLTIVLVLGTIALTASSFSVEAQATSDREKDYDHDDKSRYYNEHDYDSYGKKSYRDDDYGKDKYDKRYDSYDKKSYYKDDYKSEYTSYGKYEDRDHDKYKKDSSSSVFVKKVKCNNINVNLNGINANIGIPNDNGPVTEPIAVAQALDNDNEGAQSFGNNGESRQSDANTHSKIVCINNNNNIVVAEEKEEPEQNPCIACFEKFLSADEITTFVELFGVESRERFCILFVNPEDGSVIPEQPFRDSLPNVAPGVVDDLIECLEDAGVEFIQLPPPP